MPSVMIRRNEEGDLTLYIAKKDLEDTIVSMEKDGPEGWGGKVVLANGASFYLEPMAAQPKLPITLRARRA